MKSGYLEDLAYIHDVGFSGFAMQAAPGLLGILRQCGVTQELVVDLGCGSGLWARELDRAGYPVLGVDISAAMLQIARQRVPEARFQRGSFLEVALPPCGAVTAIGECLNYLFDAANKPERLVQFFRRVYQALRPGGVFVFDVAEPGRGGGRGPRQRNFQGEDWALLLETEEDRHEAILTRRMTTFRRVGRLYRRGEEIHRLHLYRGAEIVTALRRLGFRNRRLRGYGDFRLPRGLVGIVARKPRLAVQAQGG
jgi:SAM-dependent methyltransferase